jgi:hypothetical protein
MLRRTLIPALAAATAAVMPATAGADVSPLAARARLVTCHAGAEPAGRYLTAEATMRALSAGNRMQLRFDLQRHTDAGRFLRVSGPGLGSWNQAAPGVARFRFRKTIANLPVGWGYRVVVRYRWLDGAGQVLARAVRHTATCWEPDPRPDLWASSVDVAPGPSPGTRTYLVLVRNTGRSAAADFDVQLSVAGAAQPPATVPGLAAGGRQRVAIVGPRCSTGEPLRVAVDPDDRVDESNERNDVRTFPCP